MRNLAVLEKTKEYLVIKVPRRLVRGIEFPEQQLTEAVAVKILRSGMREYRQGKTKALTSLRDLRHGD